MAQSAGLAMCTSNMEHNFQIKYSKIFNFTSCILYNIKVASYNIIEKPPGNDTINSQ